jgi:hypothetical protein
MNRILYVIAFAACLLAGAASAEAEEWLEYRPAGVGFRVELPGKPEIEDNTAKAGANTTRMIIASVSPSDEYAYLAMYSVFKPETLNSDPEKSLDGGMRGLAGQGKVRSEKRLTIGTVPARYAIVDMADNQVGVDLMTMTGNILIQVICVVPKGQETSPTVDRVMKSFALVAR